MSLSGIFEVAGYIALALVVVMIIGSLITIFSKIKPQVKSDTDIKYLNILVIEFILIAALVIVGAALLWLRLRLRS